MNDRDRARDMRRDLGHRLRELRTKAGLSQQQLASRTGYTRSAVSNSESGGYAARRFWQKCDELFDTDALFVDIYERMHAQVSLGRNGGIREDGTAPVPCGGLGRLGAVGDWGRPADAMAAYRGLGWPVERDRDHLALLTGTAVDALEVPRPAGLLAAHWWLYTGGAADEVRGLPALPSPTQALVLIAAGSSCFFLAASGPFAWTEPDMPDDRQATGDDDRQATGDTAAGKTATIRWHCLGSRIPVPPSVLADGQLATWVHLPARQVRLTPAIGLLDLLAKAAAMYEPGRLRLPGGVFAIAVTGAGRHPADDTSDTV